MLHSGQQEPEIVVRCEISGKSREDVKYVVLVYRDGGALLLHGPRDAQVLVEAPVLRRC